MLPVDLSQFQLNLIAPELVLIGFGFVLLLVGVFSEKSENRAYAGMLTVAGLAMAAFFTWNLLGVTDEAFYGAIIVDGMSTFIKLLLLAGAVIVALISIDYLDDREIAAYEYYSLMLFATSGMMLLASSADLLSILVSIEIMSMSIYVLVGIRRDDSFATEAAFKYFVLGSFASGILVFGIALVFGATQTVNLSGIAGVYETGALLEPKLFIIGMGLILVGFAFKIASVPFHMWAPDVYQGAPAPITGFMATGVKAAAFVAMLRVFNTAFGAGFDQWQPILWWLAVITMLGGNLLALMQENIKRLLAYSGIAHAGYLLIGLVVGGKTAGAAMLYYLAAYTFMNLGAFGVIAAVSKGSEELDNLHDWTGMGYKRPLLSAVMALCLFSMAGIPPMAGFFAKFYLFYAAVEQGQITLIIVAVLASAISLYYYLKVLVYMYMKEATQSTPIVKLSTGAGLGVLMAVAAVLYLGLLPAKVLELARISIASLF